MTADRTIILITGANGGIGFETTVQLLASATNHVLLCSRSVDKGEAALRDIESRQLPGSASLLQLDVVSPDSIAAAVKQVEREHGHIDVLVNNAGVESSRHLEVLETNVIGPSAVTQAFEPLLKKSAKVPRIVNVTSGLGSIALRLDKQSPFYGVEANMYRASKSALNMLTACQAVRYEPDGWKVFAYCPGFSQSNLGKYNKAEFGAQPTADAAAPLVKIVAGERDGEAGGFLHGRGTYPW